MFGAFALRYHWLNRISKLFGQVKFRSWIAMGLIVLLIVFHGLVPNFIVAPLTALGFIFLFLQINLPKWLSGALDYMAPHATNLWLIHMFFYLIYFRTFIYSATYVIPVFLLLVGVCLLSSYVVKGIETPVKKLLNVSVKIQNSK